MARRSKARSKQSGANEEPYSKTMGDEGELIWQSCSKLGVPYLNARLVIGARDSSLSKAQVQEIENELQISFDAIFIKTTGDLDQKTSLRNLEKTDFFTKELDRLLLDGKIDAAIHSAKDLPSPLPRGLKIVYLSKGKDPRDSLVIKKWPIKTIATSSDRREMNVRKLFPKAQIVDIRGTIEKRLEAQVDAIIIAECALLRLRLTHLNRMFIPGETAENQGKIAIVAREDFIFRP